MSSTKSSFTDRVNTTMDFELKANFMSLQYLHKKDLRDAVERGALDIIADIDPEKALELEISILRNQLMEKEQTLLKLQSMKNISNQLKQINKNSDPALEKLRLDKFKPIRINIANQVRKGNADWKKIAEVFFFDSTNEAREWTINQLQEESLIDRM